MPVKPFEPFTCDIRLEKSNWNEFYERLMFTATEKKKAAAFLEIMKLLLKKESTNLHLAWNAHETHMKLLLTRFELFFPFFFLK